MTKPTNEEICGTPEGNLAAAAAAHDKAMNWKMKQESCRLYGWMWAVQWRVHCWKLLFLIVASTTGVGKLVEVEPDPLDLSAENQGWGL
jgi:hypothetical protein